MTLIEVNFPFILLFTTYISTPISCNLKFKVLDQCSRLFTKLYMVDAPMYS